MRDQQPPGAPPYEMVVPSHSTRRSVETLVLVLAVITIVCVLAGFIARFCGGRHFGRNGENDIDGWIERRCRSCIDSGIPPLSEEPKQPAEAAANK